MEGMRWILRPVRVRREHEELVDDDEEDENGDEEANSR